MNNWRLRKEVSLSHEELTSLMDYDPETGEFCWKVKRTGPQRSAPNPKKYLRYKIHGVNYRAHHLAWFYVYAKWPESEVIDHVDRNIHNNRIDNLKEATFVENALNREAAVKVAPGVKKIRNKFRATVQREFDTQDEAEAWIKSLNLQ